MMTDPDLLARAEAFDLQGRLVLWTPEAVGRRLVEAYDVLRRTPMRVGPKSYGSAHPEIFRALPDLGDVVWWANLREEWENKVARNANSPGAEEISRSDDALHWCARYLGDRPLLADAISLWAACLGLRRSLRRAIKERCQLADTLLDRAKMELPDIVTIYTDEARAAAARVAGRANVAMARTADEDQISRIRAGAGIEFARAVRKEGIVERQVQVTRPDVMPGRNFRRRAIHDRRKEAELVISEALNAARIAVREAAEHISADDEE